MGFASSLFFLALSSYLGLSDGSDQSTQPANIIMIMLDDMGRADIGAYGSEWETPNLDSFISNSITLSHHYVGYVCSASRSQFLSGRYAYYNGFARQYPFDRGEIGGLPLGIPTIADYLKKYSNYNTYAIGKWQLGGSIYEQLPTQRGFDYFYGFLGGFEDYYTKSTQIWSNMDDPFYIKNDKTEYLDFWENNEPNYDSSNENLYSTTQYFDKIIEVISDNANKNANTNENEKNANENVSPFFIYAALQANHIPFAKESEFYTKCQGLYSTKLYGKDSIDSRDGVCEAMLAVDDGIGKLVKYLKEDIENKDIWENTLIIFTSDNGGSLSESGCNYPLRGGKNSYFEGNQRVLSFVGGGIIEENERNGIVLDGLVSNVDWVPTLLAFADIIPSDYYSISFKNDKIDSENEIALSLDGYNIYEYLMSPNGQSMRDHIVFTMVRATEQDYNDAKNDKLVANVDINEDAIKEFLLNHELSQFAIIMYDDSNTLWKYFYTEASTNPLGGLTDNAGWCRMNSDNSDKFLAQTLKSSKYTIEEVTESCDNGIFDISNDESEENNLLTTLSSEDLAKLTSMVESKLGKYYLNEDSNENSKYISECYDCFFTRYNELAYPKKFNDVWAPFLSKEEFVTMLETDCKMDTSHEIYKLHSKTFSLPDDMVENVVNNEINVDISGINKNAVVMDDSGSIQHIVSKKSNNGGHSGHSSGVFEFKTVMIWSVVSMALMVVSVLVFAVFKRYQIDSNEDKEGLYTPL